MAGQWQMDPIVLAFAGRQDKRADFLRYHRILAASEHQDIGLHFRQSFHCALLDP
jgi:hypothetical protein